MAWKSISYTLVILSSFTTLMLTRVSILIFRMVSHLSSYPFIFNFGCLLSGAFSWKCIMCKILKEKDDKYYLSLGLLLGYCVHWLLDFGELLWVEKREKKPLSLKCYENKILSLEKEKKKKWSTRGEEIKGSSKIGIRKMLWMIKLSKLSRNKEWKKNGGEKKKAWFKKIFFHRVLDKKKKKESEVWICS